MKKLAVVCASELTIKAFLLGHLRALAQRYEVTVFADTADRALLRRSGINVDIVNVPIARKIHPLRDLLALIRLYRLLRTGRFDIVHSVTPKAGLIAMAAARLAGVPCRVHTFTGQVWVTRSGLMRAILKLADNTIAALTTHVLADSRSQIRFMVDQGVVRDEKATLLAEGSISGVDTERFKPDIRSRTRIRAELGIGANDIVFIYLGRLNRDKGLLDLCQAFSRLGAANAHLLIVGPDEEGLASKMRALAIDRTHFVGPTAEPEAYYAAADVFCLASYREGFGTSVIEAAASGLPAIGSRIYGVVDAIVEGNTGMLFAPGDSNELARLMQRFIEQPNIITTMGEQARRRAEGHFAAPILVQALLDFYRDLELAC